MTNYTISHNDAYNSLEITFPTMPSARIRCGLKERGFRWHSMKHLWYGKCDENELRAMIENERGTTDEQPEAEAPAPAEIPAPATAVFNQNTAMELVAELDALRTMLTTDSDDNKRALLKLDEIRELAREELARTNTRKHGMTQTRNVAKRMLKSVKKANPNSAFCYPAYLNGQQIICDTYKLISLNTPIDGLGERPGIVAEMHIEKSRWER